MVLSQSKRAPSTIPAKAGAGASTYQLPDSLALRARSGLVPSWGRARRWGGVPCPRRALVPLPAAAGKKSGMRARSGRPLAPPAAPGCAWRAPFGRGWRAAAAPPLLRHSPALGRRRPPALAGGRRLLPARPRDAGAPVAPLRAPPRRRALRRASACAPCRLRLSGRGSCRPVAPLLAGRWALRPARSSGASVGAPGPPRAARCAAPLAACAAARLTPRVAAAAGCGLRLTGIAPPPPGLSGAAPLSRGARPRAGSRAAPRREDKYGDSARCGARQRKGDSARCGAR